MRSVAQAIPSPLRGEDKEEGEISWSVAPSMVPDQNRRLQF